MSLGPRRGWLSKASPGPEASAVGGAWATGGPQANHRQHRCTRNPTGHWTLGRIQSLTVVKKRRSSQRASPWVLFLWEKDTNTLPHRSAGWTFDRAEATLNSAKSIVTFLHSLQGDTLSVLCHDCDCTGHWQKAHTRNVTVYGSRP